MYEFLRVLKRTVYRIRTYTYVSANKRARIRIFMLSYYVFASAIHTYVSANNISLIGK